MSLKQPYSLPPNSVWFITGCSSGIGRALATLIATEHPTHRLVATARDPSSLSYLSSLSSSPDNILILPLDVTSQTSISSAISAALNKFSRIDVLVNNAGYMLSGDTEACPLYGETSPARREMETNFWGTISLTQSVLPIMRDTSHGGVILNVTSMGGRITAPGSAFYHASKWAVEGFIESLAKELRPEWGIRLSLIEPGGVSTNFVDKGTVKISPGHPAYQAEDSPARMLEGYTQDENMRKLWADPGKIAQAMYDVVAIDGVSKPDGIPLRVPLGPDSWGFLMKENERDRKSLEEAKDRALGVGKEGQLEAVAALGFL
ncbi:short-chain dehydrogenase [Podospora australis]|uniref:Short-chain dehydrogenase n=1 Tax=Podospora australis TaxID=1536484 RepID=A0AAN7AKL1_9PEZI|nr:short-chain dehydrogenase [Podospora australis]